MSREAMQLALEALEDANDVARMEFSDEDYYGEAITALRQALEEKQEPFEYWNAVEGWVKIDEVREHFNAVGCGTIYKSAGEGRSPLYTAPLKQWVGLTEEEIYDCEEEVGMPQYEISSADLYAFASVIEAKLREKNT